MHNFNNQKHWLLFRHSRPRSFKQTIYFICQNNMVVVVVISCLVISVSFSSTWTRDHQAPLPVGFPRQEYWGWFSFSLPEDLFSQLRDFSTLGHVLWQVDSLSLSHQENTPKQHSIYLRNTSWLSYVLYQTSNLYSLRLFRTTLVIHWLIVSFPTILVGEDPTCWSVTKLMGHNSGAHVPKLEPVFSNKRNITMGRLCSIVKCTVPLTSARESPWTSMTTWPHQNKCNF